MKCSFMDDFTQSWHRLCKQRLLCCATFCIVHAAKAQSQQQHVQKFTCCVGNNTTTKISWSECCESKFDHFYLLSSADNNAFCCCIKPFLCKQAIWKFIELHSVWQIPLVLCTKLLAGPKEVPVNLLKKASHKKKMTFHWLCFCTCQCSANDVTKQNILQAKRYNNYFKWQQYLPLTSAPDWMSANAKNEEWQWVIICLEFVAPMCWATFSWMESNLSDIVHLIFLVKAIILRPKAIFALNNLQNIQVHHKMLQALKNRLRILVDVMLCPLLV